MKDKILVISILIALFLFSRCSEPPSNSNKQHQSGLTDTAKTKQDKKASKDSSLNQKDNQGRKQGLWIENDGLSEVYYWNGLKSGIYKVYFAKTGKLEALGDYEQDKPVGSWYYFDETSRLFMIERKLGEGKEIKLKNDEGSYIILANKSFIKVYNKNGILIRKGLAIYDEDVQLEFFMYGLWKYYDETGKLIREVNYKEGKIAD
jgi:antitoxin component YwqK of YwqJK toxin-antitoxin module